MLFRWKRLSKIQSVFIDYQAEKIDTLSAQASVYQNIIGNIAFHRQQFADADIYTVNNDVYYIYSHADDSKFFNIVCQWDLYTFKLNDIHNNYDNWVCKSESDIYIQDGIKVLKLVNIDTRFEGRSGHASRQLKKIMLYARDHDIHKIYGNLLQETCIGTDNLRHFYEKNGFVVDRDVFYMNL